MDTITHALAGALAGRAGSGRHRDERLSPARAGWAVLIAGVFPDIDFVVAFFDPYAYLVWHRLATHTLVLLPFWALFLAWVAGLIDSRRGWRRYLPYMAVGLALHIVMDAFNIWPLKPLWPLMDWTVAWPVLFVIDPIYTGLIVVGLLLSMFWRVHAGAWLALGLVAVYTIAQFPLNAMAARHGSVTKETYAYGQPFSPFHRRVVVMEDDGPRWAFLRQFARTGWWGFEPSDALQWQHGLHPLAAGSLVTEAWNRTELEDYRNFVTVPYVYGVATEGHALCVWFADVRFTLPDLQPAFRWGMCRSTDGAWSRHQRGRW